MRPVRILLWFAGCAVLAALLYVALRPRPVAVEVAAVTRGPFVETVDEDGRTRVRERYAVAAPLAGRLLRLPVKAGDSVAVDQVVATILPALPALIDPRTRHDLEERIGAAEAAIAENTAQAERAKAVLGQAEADAQRARTLRKTGVVAQQTLERAELAVLTAEREKRAAELRRHVAEHVLDQARALLRRFDDADPAERLEVRSPVAGQVLRVVRESESPVSAGDPLLEVGDPHDLEIAVDVLTTDAVAIHPGASVTIDHWGGAEPLQGRVRRVEPGAFTKVSALGVEEQRVWVLIDLTTPPERWTALGDAYRVDVRITTHEQPDAVQVPVSALFRRGTAWAVFVVKDGATRERIVDIGRRASATALVTGGLEPGEQVVVFPPSRLKHGGAVTIRSRTD